MASPSYTYTLINGTTASASEVMQDFNDILNGVTDGTKDLSISALTCAGTATLNGHVNIGNSSADDLTITASLASTVNIKTDSAFDIGSTSLRLRKVFSDAYSGVADNSSAAAGEIGEKIEALPADFNTAPAAATYVDITSASIALTPGMWRLMAFGVIGLDQTASNSQMATPVLAIRTSADALVMQVSGFFTSTGAGTSAGGYGPVFMEEVIQISSNTTYKLSIKYENYSGTATVSNLGFRINASTFFTNKGYIRAIRIR